LDESLVKQFSLINQNWRRKQMYKQILVPLDGSKRAERSLPIAANIARNSGGSITLLRVVTTTDAYSPFMRSSLLALEIRQTALTGAAKYLSDVAESPLLHNIEVKTAVMTGLVGQTILDIVKEQHSDLIIIASHGASGASRWMLGSVAQQIARSSTAPVLVVRDGGAVPASPYPDLTRPLHPITVAVGLDGSTLAEAAILPAAELVHTLTAPVQGLLHLTRIVQLSEHPTILGSLPHNHHSDRKAALAEAEDYLLKKQLELQEHLESHYQIRITWSVVVADDIAQGLLRVAEDGAVDLGVSIFGGCDILALATHGRSGLQRITLGSVTEHVLGRTMLPLLIVRPHPLKSTHLPGEPAQQEMRQVRG
jgi:nucleotide-binding universal stress UspA family protein